MLLLSRAVYDGGIQGIEKSGQDEWPKQITKRRQGVDGCGKYHEKHGQRLIINNRDDLVVFCCAGQGFRTGQTGNEVWGFHQQPSGHNHPNRAGIYPD